MTVKARGPLVYPVGQIEIGHFEDMLNQILKKIICLLFNIDGVLVTNICLFGRTDGQIDRRNNNIPEMSLENAGIIISNASKAILI